MVKRGRTGGQGRGSAPHPARRRGIVIVATAAILLAGGAYLHSSAANRAGEQPESGTSGQADAGDISAPSHGGGTTEDWGGTGLTATALDPSRFSPGACMAFTPEGGARRDQTVFIDAGHGGIDPGGVGETETGAQVDESTINLPVEMDVMKLLTSEGYRVVVSRTEQTTVVRLAAGDTDGGLLTVAGVEADIAARDICANIGHADLLVGIYMDSGDAGEAGSLTAYDAARSFSQDNLRFANLLQGDVLAKLNAAGYGIPDDGVQNDTQLGSSVSAAGDAYGHLMLLGPAYPPGNFTTPSEMPGALIEPLFLSDPFEASVAVSSKGQELIADGVAEAVGEYFTPAPG